MGFPRPPRLVRRILVLPLGSWTLILSTLALTYLISTAGLMPPTPIVRGELHQMGPPAEKYFRRPTAQANGIVPSKGPPGTEISISAGGFRDFDTVESITIGGVDILGSRTVNTDDDGNFHVEGLVVPGLDPGVVALTIRVGTGDLETTAVGTFEITRPAAGLSGTVTPVREALAPLGDSLERVFHFENTTKEWSFFDPLPAFLDANSLSEIHQGQVYWIKVEGSMRVELNGRHREVTCAREGSAQQDCWNVVVW
jgi:hypothetical protein